MIKILDKIDAFLEKIAIFFEHFTNIRSVKNYHMTETTCTYVNKVDTKNARLSRKLFTLLNKPHRKSVVQT